MIAMILAYSAFCVGLRWTTLVLVPMNMSACAKMDTMFSWHLMDHPAMECQQSGRIFMAGFLHHLPSILAFTAPIPYRLRYFPIIFQFLLIFTFSVFHICFTEKALLWEIVCWHLCLVVLSKVLPNSRILHRSLFTGNAVSDLYLNNIL